MAELTIKTDDITAVLRRHLEGFEPSLEARTVGRVIQVGDGIARVSGLPECGVNELLEFEDGTAGLRDEVVAEVRTAVELTPDQETRLAAALANATGKNVSLKPIVDPSVLGGVLATVGDTVIDGSVRTRLEQLKSRL